jgi:hypothetical protein
MIEKSTHQYINLETNFSDLSIINDRDVCVWPAKRGGRATERRILDLGGEKNPPPGLGRISLARDPTSGAIAELYF